MRWFLILLFLCVGFQGSAQNTVAEFCRAQKALYDSAMYQEYGELFHSFFVFNEESGAWTDPNHVYYWNDTTRCDSIRIYAFDYYFIYPGAFLDSSLVYGPSVDRWGRLIPDTIPNPGKCTPGNGNPKCEIIATEDMDSLTRKYLKKPLKVCTVNVYPYYSYGEDDTMLDSSHVYLEVQYARYRGSHERAKRFRVTTWTIVVDATSGQVLGPAVKDGYEGTVGRF